jgi:hypothetical protein
MMVFDKQLLSAQKMIAKYGQVCTLRKITNGTPDPTKPWEPVAPTTSDVSVRIAFFPNTRTNNEFLHYIPGTEVPAGIEVGYLAGDAPAPALQDLVIRDGKTIAILSIDRIAPNGEVVLYILGLGE